MTNAEQLHDWHDLADRGWRSLLFGNGFSMNICSDFGYSKLFHEAPLSDAAVALFDQFKTTNFELVLERMLFAQQINEALEFPQAGLKRLAAEHDGIREALFAAVGRTHIKHAEIPTETLQHVAEHLLTYNRVFTTNYDLLPYWAVMAYTGRKEFMDLFRRPGAELVFEPTIAAWFPRRTRVYYLHGGLHLWRDDWTGTTGKWEATPAGLLDLEARYQSHPDRQPLLVSEGTAEHKYAAIQRSGYLSFALQELTRDTAPLVVLGSNFGDSDEHIVKAIQARAGHRQIAIGLHVGRTSQIQLNKRMADLRARFEGHGIVFFDVSSHPLGELELNVR